MHRFILSLLVFICSLPGTMVAQMAPDLIVTLSDTTNRGVVAIVSVRDESGRQELAHAMTGTDGRATFQHLPESRIRVAVSGSVGGLELHQDGADTKGVLLLLSAPPSQLDLRVDSDELVLPDPATTIAPDRGAPLYPTAPFAAPATIAAPVAMSTAAPAPAPPQTAATSAVPNMLPAAIPLEADVAAQLNVLYLVLALLWGIGMVVVLVWLRRRGGWRRR